MIATTLIYIPIEGDLVKNYTVFKDEAVKMPGIVSISKMRKLSYCY